MYTTKLIGKHNQDAVCWIKLSRTQDQGLQFWQTKSFALITYATVPGDCIDRVISQNGRSSIIREAGNTKASAQGYAQKQLACAAAAATHSQGRRKKATRKRLRPGNAEQERETKRKTPPKWKKQLGTGSHQCGPTATRFARFSSSMKTQHLPVRVQTHNFSRAHITVHNSLIVSRSSNVVTSALAQDTRDQCRAFLKKTMSPLRHVLVWCAFRSFPSCRFISYFVCVTTFSVANIVREDQIKALPLCSLEGNVWLLRQSAPKHINEEHTPINLPDLNRNFLRRWRHKDLHHRGPRRISTFRSIHQQHAYRSKQSSHSVRIFR